MSNLHNLDLTWMSHEPAKEPRSVAHDHIKAQAQQAGIKLSEEHWDVIDFVLDVYDNCEECRSARQLMALMDKQFKSEGGKRYLYGLFPEGPVSQIHDLAGMAALSSQRDYGFGTSY